MTRIFTLPEARSAMLSGRVVQEHDGRSQRLRFQRGAVVPPAINGGKGPEPCDEPYPSAYAGTYYVLPDQPGASDGNVGQNPLQPWATLAPVRALLGTAAYRGGVRIILADTTFSLETEGLGDDFNDRFLEIHAWGSTRYPIELLGIGAVNGAPSDEGHAMLEGQDPFFDPILDLTLDPGGNSQLQGIVLERTCHVILSRLRVSGFDHGIVIRGCEDIHLTACRVDENWTRGIAILPTTRYDADRKKVPDVASKRVTVSFCDVHDNGWRTNGANVVLGSYAADCTIQNSNLYSSSSVRGVDGITFDGTSSGHVVERCLIHGNVSAQDDDGSDGDGIDLKGVRQRDPADGAVTIIRDNEIYDNQGAGIVLHFGCQGIHVLRNRIRRTKRGIGIIPAAPRSETDIESVAYPYDGVGNTYVDAFVQGEIYIYRNIISRCLLDGIHIELEWPKEDEDEEEEEDPIPFDAVVFRDILVVNNTIDYNGNEGVFISRPITNTEYQDLMTGTAAQTFTLREIPRWFERIGVYNNIISRNGLRLAWDGSDTQRFAQLTLQELIYNTYVDQTGATESDFSAFYIDHNLYQMPRQVDPDNPHTVDNVILPIYFSYFEWKVDKFAAVSQANRLISVDDFTLAGLGETWSTSAINPGDPGFLVHHPRSVDHHVVGTASANPALTGAVGTVLNPLPSGRAAYELIHIEDGVAVPVATDLDGALPSGAPWLRSLGAYHP